MIKKYRRDSDIHVQFQLTKNAIKPEQVSKSIVSVLFKCSVCLYEPEEICALNFNALIANHRQLVVF